MRDSHAHHSDLTDHILFSLKNALRLYGSISNLISKILHTSCGCRQDNNAQKIIYEWSADVRAGNRCIYLSLDISDDFKFLYLCMLSLQQHIGLELVVAGECPVEDNDLFRPVPEDRLQQQLGQGVGQADDQYSITNPMVLAVRGGFLLDRDIELQAALEDELVEQVLRTGFRPHIVDKVEQLLFQTLKLLSSSLKTLNPTSWGLPSFSC